MDPSCPRCMEIAALEHQIDVEANDLTNLVRSIIRPTVVYNNRLWRIYHALVAPPVIGPIIFSLTYRLFTRFLKAPAWPFDDGFYKRAGEDIMRKAHVLEEHKEAHLEHWGDETISPMNGWDHAGYYTPLSAKRRDALRMNYYAATPEKYDFRTMAGVHKFEAEILVVCSVTRRLVPVNECDWTWRSGHGTRYFHRSAQNDMHNGHSQRNHFRWGES